MSLPISITSDKFFFPEGCSAQSWITNFLTAQINSSSLSKLKEVLLHDSSAEPDVDKIVKEIGDRSEKVLLINSASRFKFDKTYLPKYLHADISSEKRIKIYKLLNSMTPAQQACLVPKINLFYREKKKNGKIRDRSFPFRNFTNVDDILKSEFSRGDGSAIVSLKVDRKFIDPSGTIPNISVTLDFMFQSLAVFNEIPKDNTEVEFNKLISPTSNVQGDFLILEYGWGLSDMLEDGLFPEDLRSYFEQYETKKLIIQYKGAHKLDFDETGKVKITAEYLALQEVAFFSEVNLTIPENETIVFDIKQDGAFRELYKTYLKELDSLNSIETRLKNFESNPDFLMTDKKVIEIKNDLIKQRAVIISRINILKQNIAPFTRNMIVDLLIKNNSLFHINFQTKDKILKTEISLVTREIIDKTVISKKKLADITGNILSSDKLKGKSIISSKSTSSLKGEIEKAIEDLYNVGSSEKTFGNILFFPLKELIHVLYQFMNQTQYNKFGYTLFCNTIIKSLGKDLIINIGDAFVELSTFQKWYFNEFIKSGLIDYSFGDFTKKICETLIPEVLSTKTKTYPRYKTGKVTVENFFYTNKSDDKRNLYPIPKGDILEDFAKRISTDKILSVNAFPISIFTTVPSILYSKSASYLSFPFEGITKFDEKRDSAKGIFYIVIGASAGLLKKISFNSDDFSYLRTALWQQSQKDYTINQVRYKYSINGSFIGTSLFYNGSVCCIPSNPLGLRNTSGFQPDIGICGYYIVMSNTDTIQDMKYETSINAMNIWNPEIKRNKTISTASDEDAEKFDVSISHDVIDYFVESLKNDTSKYGLAVLELGNDISVEKRSQEGLTNGPEVINNEHVIKLAAASLEQKAIS